MGVWLRMNWVKLRERRRGNERRSADQFFDGDPDRASDSAGNPTTTNLLASFNQLYVNGQRSNNAKLLETRFELNFLSIVFVVGVLSFCHLLRMTRHIGPAQCDS